MCVLYPTFLKRSGRVTSSRGNPHGMKSVNSSNCIPVRKESRPVMRDAFLCHSFVQGKSEEEEDDHDKERQWA